MTDPAGDNTASSALEILGRIDAFLGDDLIEVERILHDELDSWNPYVRDILSHVTRFRGKRLRPILLLLAGAGSGGVRDSHKLLAAVVEMIHVATLVHDDILDDAVTRRHVATVNARWNNETSVLFGDYLFTHAFHLASHLDTTDACRQIGRSTNLVCEGELTQVHERGNLDLTEETYLRIIDGKTAELCALCCRLGAQYAEADETVVRSLDRYGRSLGLAFQIADDLLDLTGSERKTGKTLGSDLQKQKLTMPVIRLLKQAAPGDAFAIRELLMRPDDQTADNLRPYIEASDAVEYASRRASEYSQEACRALDVLPDSEPKQLLEALALFAVQRPF